MHHLLVFFFSPSQPHHSRSRSPATRSSQQTQAQLRAPLPSRSSTHPPSSSSANPSTHSSPTPRKTSNSPNASTTPNRASACASSSAACASSTATARRVPLRQRLDAAARRPGLRAGAAAGGRRQAAAAAAGQHRAGRWRRWEATRRRCRRRTVCVGPQTCEADGGP